MNRNVVLKAIVHRTAESLPQFNDQMLLEFRESKVAGMLDYLDRHFRAIEWFKGEVTYIGYSIMIPEERLAGMMVKNSAYRGRVSIQPSTVIVVKFIFQLPNGNQYPAVIEIPYMVDRAIIIKGVKYHPLLVIVERILNRINDDKIAIKVARAQLRFIRNIKAKFVTSTNTTYSAYIPTAKLHLGKGGARRDKKPDKVPIVLYHLCAYGWAETMRYYGIEPADLTVIPELNDDPDFTQVKIQEGMYLNIRRSLLEKETNRRVIASLLRIMVLVTVPYTIRDVMDPGAAFFKIALGEYICTATNQTQLFQQADEHLRSNRTLIDPAAASSLASVGIEAADTNALLLHAFFSIDEWLALRNPNDLYTKQLGNLSHMLAELVRMVMSKQYESLRRGGPLDSAVTTFVRQISTSARYVKGWMFRTVTDASLDNWLLTIGAKRLRTFKTMEQGSKAKGGSRTGIPVSVLPPHPSEIAITSLFTMPAKAPLMAGSINPFALIDAEGNFVAPPWADEIADVFEC